MVETAEEMEREKILQGKGKGREFHFLSGKIYIFGISQGEMKS